MTITLTVGDTIIVHSKKPRTDGTVDKQSALVRIVKNNGTSVSWEVVKLLAGENVLRPLSCGGFALWALDEMIERGEIELVQP